MNHDSQFTTSRSALTVAVVICSVLAVLSLTRLIADRWSLASTASENAEIEVATNRLQTRLAEFRQSTTSVAREVSHPVVHVNRPSVVDDAPGPARRRPPKQVLRPAYSTPIIASVDSPLRPQQFDAPLPSPIAPTAVVHTSTVSPTPTTVVNAPVTVNVDQGAVVAELQSMRRQMETLVTESRSTPQPESDRPELSLAQVRDIARQELSAIAAKAQSDSARLRRLEELATVGTASLAPTVHKMPGIEFTPAPVAVESPQHDAPAKLRIAETDFQLIAEAPAVEMNEPRPAVDSFTEPNPSEPVAQLDETPSFDFTVINEPSQSDVSEASLAAVPPAIVDEIEFEQFEESAFDNTPSESEQEIMPASFEVVGPQQLFDVSKSLNLPADSLKPEISANWTTSHLTTLPAPDMTRSAALALPSMTVADPEQHFVDPFGDAASDHSPHARRLAGRTSTDTNETASWMRPRWFDAVADWSEERSDKVRNSSANLFSRSPSEPRHTAFQQKQLSAMHSSGKPGYVAPSPDSVKPSSQRAAVTHRPVAPKPDIAQRPSQPKDCVTPAAHRETPQQGSSEVSHLLHRATSTLRFATSPRVVR